MGATCFDPQPLRAISNSALQIIRFTFFPRFIIDEGSANRFGFCSRLYCLVVQLVEVLGCRFGSLDTLRIPVRLNAGGAVVMPERIRPSEDSCNGKYPPVAQRQGYQTSTLSACLYRELRSSAPFVPPLIARVIASNWSASALTFKFRVDQYQTADFAAHSGCSSNSGVSSRRASPNSA